MHVKVRLFAILRERAGWRDRVLELPAGTTIADAWAVLEQTHPALAPARAYVRFARNGRYAALTDQLSDGDELAAIPPIAGGADVPPLLRCELRPDPLSDDLLAELRRTVPTAADGALVLFVGQTRETAGRPAPGEEQEAARHAGQPVEWLDYEGYEPMALALLHDIGAEIEARFGVRRLAMIHRTGRVPLAQPSVVIAAAAPNRDAAFAACRYAIEELKARAPIFKSEHYADGSVWIGAPALEGRAAERAEEG